MPKIKNDIFVGLEYRDMVVISKDEESGGAGKHFLWNLKCKCSKIHKMRSQCIRQGVVPYCDCRRNFEDLTGFQINNIIVCGFAGYDNRYNRKKPQWFYQCLKCNLIKIYTGEVIKRGDNTTEQFKEFLEKHYNKSLDEIIYKVGLPT